MTDFGIGSDSPEKGSDMTQTGQTDGDDEGDGIDTTCHKCDYEWEYSGQRERGQYCACPACKTSTKVGLEGE